MEKIKNFFKHLVEKILGKRCQCGKENNGQ